MANLHTPPLTDVVYNDRDQVMLVQYYTLTKSCFTLDVVSQSLRLYKVIFYRLELYLPSEYKAYIIILRLKRAFERV